MTIEDSPVNGINSNDSGESRAMENGKTVPCDDLFSVKFNRKNLGLIRLEQYVVALTIAGYSREETAKRIGISKTALRLHLKSIYDKLGVSNQFELVLFALSHQLIDTDGTSPRYD
jgi:DNA-binding CsgD family transcriptional regulator